MCQDRKSNTFKRHFVSLYGVFKPNEQTNPNQKYGGPLGLPIDNLSDLDYNYETL